MEKNSAEKYVIVCDESTRKGKKYSYFFGGAIVLEREYQKVNDILRKYAELKELGEVKRTKITSANYNSYIGLLDLFFTFIKGKEIRARVMFAGNDQLERIPHSLDETYCKFYYLFIRYAFCIYYASKHISLRLIFDELPEQRTACQKFKSYLVHNLNLIDLHNDTYVNLIQKDIEEVDSKKHMVLQCMDVITGLVDFALNSSAEDRKSKRGKAKFAVWKFVMTHIQELHSDFILTKTTPPINSIRGWKDPYKHFVFTNKNKTPAVPT